MSESDLEELPMDIAGAAVSDIPKSRPSDNAYKVRILGTTAIVLLYPLAFLIIYPLLARAIDSKYEQVSLTVGPIIIQGLESVAFVLVGGAVLFINFVVALFLQRHLQSVHEDVAAAIAEIRGFAAAGGQRAQTAINQALANFQHLLSWRYLFSYIGPLTLAAYLFLFAVSALAFLGVIPFEPASQLAGYFMLYYVIAFGVRRLLRWMTKTYLDH